MVHTQNSTRRTSRRPRVSLAEYGRTSIARAQGQESKHNDAAVISAFEARGIVATPRVDVFTFAGWTALGRYVRKGEHGVKIPTYYAEEKPTADGTLIESGPIHRGTAVVFHISQTEARA